VLYFKYFLLQIDRYGKILISGIDLTSDLDKRPEAQQLLFSLKKYMTGEKFIPKEEISVDQISNLIK